MDPIAGEDWEFRLRGGRELGEASLPRVTCFPTQSGVPAQEWLVSFPSVEHPALSAFCFVSLPGEDDGRHHPHPLSSRLLSRSGD